MSMSPELLKQLQSAVGKPFSDPKEVLDEIKQTYSSIISKYLQPSPLKKSNWLSELTGGEIWLKLESLNPNGSFKVRGALNAIYKIMEAGNVGLKVCAASAGNHAQGVAYACKVLGCEAHIFLPQFSSLVKQEATAKLGAKLYLGGKNLEEACDAALDFARKENAFFIHPFNNYDIIIGQATCALETLNQLAQMSNSAVGDLDAFICGIGGGGLAAGSSLVIKAMSRGEVIGIEQEFYNSAIKSVKNAKLTSIDPPPHSTIADGITPGLIGNLTYEYISRYIKEMHTVNDDSIVEAVLGLIEQEHIVAEGAGAAAIAHLLKSPGKYTGKRVVACVSGGNIDPQLLSRVMTRGLNISGRVLRISACVSDRPGGLKKLLECIASLEGNVIDLIHDRTYSEVAVGDVDVELSLETRNSAHQRVMLEKLAEAGFKPRMRH